MCAAQLPFGACVEIEMLAEIEAASDGENRS
jgi:hypothetical protein